MNEELKPARRKVPDRTGTRKTRLSCLRTFLCMLTVFLTGTWGSVIHAGSWGDVTKKISIQQGTQVEAWESDRVTNGTTITRGDVTLAQLGQRAADMVPEGDGTFSLTVNLQPNAEYNYIFFAQTGGQTYYDTITGNKKGTIIVSTSSTQLTGSATAYTGSTSGGDGRRILQMPDVEDGTTVYVLNNFGDAPNPPRNVRAFPGQSAVRLKWDEPDTSWGYDGGSIRAADVLIGGGFRVFRSTDIQVGYQDVGFRAGSTATVNATFEWTDSGLDTGVTYYYIIVSSDAYSGQPGMMAIPNLTSGVPGKGAIQQAKGKTGRPVEVLFKVQNIEWEKVERKDHIVWMTPQQHDARFYRGKLKGRIIQVYVPPDEEENELINQLETSDPLPQDREQSEQSSVPGEVRGG